MSDEIVVIIEPHTQEIEIDVSPIGERGLPGEDGDPGPAGPSAYEVAVSNGFVGSEAAWLASLEGQQGIAGEDGDPGQDGAPGTDGLSAYEVWVNEGNVGDVNDYLASLVGAQGDPGPSAYDIAVLNGFTGTEAEWVALTTNALQVGEAGYTRPWRTGAWYSTPTTASTRASTPNQFTEMQLVVPRGQPVDRIAIEITTAGSDPAGTARLYIVDDGLNGAGQNLLLDAGTVATNSTGVKEIIIDYEFGDGGWYWLCVFFQHTGSNPTARANGTGTLMAGRQTASLILGGSTVGWASAPGSVSFPLGIAADTNNPIRVALRAA